LCADTLGWAIYLVGQQKEAAIQVVQAPELPPL
jgi:hypothetical protein